MTPVAVSTLVAVVYCVVLYGSLIVVPGLVAWLKGRRGLFSLGLLVNGFVWLIAAFRLARPDSWWANRFYGPRKLERARRRYADAQSTPHEPRTEPSST